MSDNQAQPSTTVVWETVKIPRRRRPTGKAAAKQHPKALLVTREEREPLFLTVTYKGGAEGWVVVQARGRVVAVPGWWSLLELVLDVNSDSWGRRGQPAAQRKGGSRSGGPRRSRGR